ncbi:MAG: TAT-variant-translocated molybdopterin oxidoreductase, partial [Calditrichia bacterium]
MKREIMNLKGKEYWRSLDQLSDTPEFQDFLNREFPEGASELKGQMNRRKFLTLMGASMALAGLTACRKPVEKIVPYVKSPEEILPGIPQFYATTMPFGLSAYGVLVESHEGRPTKIEGNEKHPSTLGKANTFMQAAILGLYDPDRSQKPKYNGEKKEWFDFLAFWKGLYPTLIEEKGKGFAILTESFASPTLFRLKQEFLKKFPQAKWYVYEPVSHKNILEGLKAATGSAYLPVYKIDHANVILALDSDFMQSENENIINARGFIKGRAVKNKNDAMNRLYAVESNYTMTGGMADHRKLLPSIHIGLFLNSLIVELKKQGLSVAGTENISRHDDFNFDEKWIYVLAKDLLDNKGESLVIAGKGQPASVHALVFALNDALGNNSKTVAYHFPKDANLDSFSGMTELVDGLQAGQIKTLAILGGNPVYNAPVDLKFKEA